MSANVWKRAHGQGHGIAPADLAEVDDGVTSRSGAWARNCGNAHPSDLGSGGLNRPETRHSVSSSDEGQMWRCTASGTKAAPETLATNQWTAVYRTIAETWHTRGVLLVRTRPQGGGGPPPPLQTPKWLYGTMGFVGAGDFVLAIRQGEIFLFF